MVRSLPQYCHLQVAMMLFISIIDQMRIKNESLCCQGNFSAIKVNQRSIFSYFIKGLSIVVALQFLLHQCFISHKMDPFVMKNGYITPKSIQPIVLFCCHSNQTISDSCSILPASLQAGMLLCHMAHITINIYRIVVSAINNIRSIPLKLAKINKNGCHGNHCGW